MQPLSSHSNARLAALSDGVFAIVLTLLALEIRMPDATAGETFAEAFAANLTVMEEYVLAFLVVGALWRLQHVAIDVVDGRSAGFLWLNLLFLGTVTITPWSLSALLDYPGDALAVVFFSGTLLLGWALLLGMTFCAGGAARIDPRLGRLRRMFGAGALVAAGSLALAGVAPGLAIYPWAALLPLMAVLR